MANKPTLKGLVASLQSKGAKPVVVELRQANPGPRPLASLLEGVIPPLTPMEVAQEEARAKRGRGYQPKGKVEAKAISSLTETEQVALAKAPHPVPEGSTLPVMTRQALNNAMAKAKQGKRLTLAERRLLGKHNLARIMVRLRPKGGDCG